MTAPSASGILFLVHWRSMIVLSCLATVTACRSDTLRVPPVEQQYPNSMCSGMPPPCSQTTLAVVFASNGKPAPGALALFGTHHAEMDFRGEARVGSMALVDGVTVSLDGLVGAWRPAGEIPERVTIELRARQ